MISLSGAGGLPVSGSEGVNGSLRSCACVRRGSLAECARSDGEFAIELLPEQQPHLDRARPPALRLEFVPPG